MVNSSSEDTLPSVTKQISDSGLILSSKGLSLIETEL